MRMTVPHLLTWSIRLILAGVFLFAAYGKLLEPGTFAESIENYRIVPEGWAVWMALYLPPLEVAAALGLLTPWLRRGSALVCAAMLGVFAIAMASAKLRGIDLDCGCFGAETQATVGAQTIARNVVLGLGALWVALTASKGETAQKGREHGSSQP